MSTLSPAMAALVSSSNAKAPYRINIMAPPGEGKTVFALGQDPAFPKEFPSKTKNLVERTAVVLFDNDGLASLRAGSGVEVKYVFDVEALLRAGKLKDYFDAMEKAKAFAKELSAAGLVDTVIHDTMSAADRGLRRWSTASGKKSHAHSNAVMDAHYAYWTHMNGLKANHIFLFHEKVQSAGDPDANDAAMAAMAARAQALAEAHGNEGDNNIVLDLFYKDTIQVYTMHSNWTAALGHTTDAATRKWARWAYSKKDKVRTKSRWGFLLNEKEPANLRAILDKIESGEQK